MKVLILPSNVASMPAITLDRLNKAGVEARAVFLDTNLYTDYRQSKAFQLKGLKYGLPHKVFNAALFYKEVIHGIRWADVIHWCGSFSFPVLNMVLPVIRMYNKPGLVEWVGSDIRIPEVEFKDNPYYKQVFHNGYEYAYESYAHSKKTQLLFKRSGFRPLVFPGMEQYILPDIFPEYYKYIQRIDLNQYAPVFPDSLNPVPRIVHAPTAPVCKGTAFIEKALDNLKQEFRFEYKLVHKIPRPKALELIASSDIFIDQLVLGSYGMATMEAFAMGKPVVCYMKESVLSCFPGVSPIINANPDSISDKLYELLSDGNLRNKKGRESRAYAEKYHDIDVVIKDLIAIYEKVLRQKI